jgi:hypothetical protein
MVSRKCVGMVQRIWNAIVSNVVQNMRSRSMPKYYIKCGTLELKYSTNKNPTEAAVTALWETNKFDVLDEYFYIDERGFRDYVTADKSTEVITLNKICRLAGWQINKSED